MKIYISGPMTGHPELNYPAFHAVAARLKEQGHIVLNPATHPDGLTYREYLHIDVAMVFAADAIYALDGWLDSQGALAEIHLAKALGLQIIFPHSNFLTINT